jgi:hypothetical protein
MNGSNRFPGTLGKLGMGLCFLLLPLASPGQYTTNGTLFTLQVTGPISNRLNVVFFSEGYTTNGLAGHFLSDVTNAMANLFTYQPYQEYQAYCNVFAIAVPSTNSGSTHPYYQETNGTFFGSSYDPANDYIITIPTPGLKKMTNLLTSLLPQAGLPIFLVNDYTDGGGGGVADVISLGPWQREILAHETGHTLGRLEDEYDYGYLDMNLTSGATAANTSQTTNLASISWKAWITNGTPIPTPDTPANANTVGLFQGANYQTKGWYRPQHDCMMRTLGTPFCAVCSEALVKAICQKAGVLDSFTPATNRIITCTNLQPLQFTLVQPQPMTHDLTNQWYVNGLPAHDATNKDFTLWPAQYTNGSYTLQVSVHDPTTLVKADPSNYLTGSLTWKLNVNAYELKLDNPRPVTPNGFSFHVSGNAPYGFIIQGSTNLTFWEGISTNSLTGGQYDFTNRLTNANDRFYRARLLP